MVASVTVAVQEARMISVNAGSYYAGTMTPGAVPASG